MPQKLKATPTQKKETDSSGRVWVTFSDGTQKYCCKHCGKWILRDTAIEAGEGDWCEHVHDELGLTAADLANHRKEFSVEQVPGDYIKLATLDKICKRAGVPICRMVDAIGGDRVAVALVDKSKRNEIHEWFRVVYVGSVRWIPQESATEAGLKLIIGDKPLRGSKKIDLTVGEKILKAGAEIKQLGKKKVPVKSTVKALEEASKE